MIRNSFMDIMAGRQMPPTSGPSPARCLPPSAWQYAVAVSTPHSCAELTTTQTPVHCFIMPCLEQNVLSGNGQDKQSALGLPACLLSVREGLATPP